MDVVRSPSRGHLKTHACHSTGIKKKNLFLFTEAV